MAVNIRVGLVDSYVYYSDLNNCSQQIKIVISYGSKRVDIGSSNRQQSEQIYCI